MNVSNKHRTSQCYGSRPRSAERGNLAWRGLGLRNRGCAQRVCTVGVHRGEVVYLLVCFALIKLHSVFIIHNFLQKFCRLPFYYVREVCVWGGTCVWMQAPKENRSMGLPGSWSCRQLWASPLECWEPSSASPEKHWMFFTVKPSLQHLISLKVKEKKKTHWESLGKTDGLGLQGHGNLVLLFQTRGVSDLRGPFPLWT